MCKLAIQDFEARHVHELEAIRDLDHHLPATFSVGSANGCVVRALDSLPTANPTHDDKTRRISGLVHDSLEHGGVVTVGLKSDLNDQLASVSAFILLVGSLACKSCPKITYHVEWDVKPLLSHSLVHGRVSLVQSVNVKPL